jgi:hypothetical protein
MTAHISNGRLAMASKECGNCNNGDEAYAEKEFMKHTPIFMNNLWRLYTNQKWKRQAAVHVRGCDLKEA